MANINSVNISGNLTRDPELRESASGNKRLTFGIAVNERTRKPGTDEWVDYPNFVDITLFGNQCDYFSSVLKKGMKVAVEGKLHYASWDKDGERRSKLTVVARTIDLISKAEKGEEAPSVDEGGMAYEDIQF